MAGWAGLWAFFEGYDLTPWRTQEYQCQFTNGASMQLHVLHYPKILLFYGRYCPASAILNIGDLPIPGREIEEWVYPIYELEQALARFDVSKGRCLTEENEGLIVYYQPKV